MNDQTNQPGQQDRPGTDQTSAPGPPPPARRPGYSFAGQLLSDITDRPLDPGYRQRRALGQTRGRRNVPLSLAVVLFVALCGLAVGAGAQQLQNARAQSTARDLLESEIHRRTELADAAAASNAEQRARIEQLQAELLASDTSGLGERVARLGLAAGATPVTGRGVTIILDDAPDADEPFGDPQAQDQKRVLDVDLAQVVNGLWTGGAEAIAVNGQRLTSTSAIRGAGSAILVNQRPLARPYVVEAIGDPANMRTELTQGESSRFIGMLPQNYGIRVEVDDAAELRLPGSSTSGLNHARPYRSAPTEAAPSGPAE